MSYDAVIIGGGLAGATLGKELASAGHEVLIIEKEAQFRDRVRGEQMHPWGIAEARKLGIYDLLKRSGAHEVRFTDLRIAGAPPAPPR
ncbi:MAG: FAD-dependent monooxygenase, partial [Pseudomonadota bacterium]|nr:FAD-dependent monooxygenase [Pseudomonadota bacterium]